MPESITTELPLDDSTPDFTTRPRTRRVSQLTYNATAPLFTAAGIALATWAYADRLLSWKPVVIALIAVVLLSAIVLLIHEKGTLSSYGAVMVTAFGLVLLYEWRHSIPSNLLTAIVVDVALLVLVFLSGVSYRWGRRSRR